MGRWLAVALALVHLACQGERKAIESKPADPPSSGPFEAAPWLGGGVRVAALAVGGAPVVAVARVGALTLHRPDGTVMRSLESPGGTPQLLAWVDLEGDGESELIAAYGLAAPTPKAPLTVRVFDLSQPLDGAPHRDIELGPTSRAQFVGLAGGPDGTWYLAHFESKYQVAIARFDPRAWTVFDRSTVRMASGLATLDRGDTLAVARIYGDSVEEPGRVELHRQGQAVEALPIVGGARAILADGGDLIVADGWDREYVRKGRALVSRLRRSAAGWQRTELTYVSGRYGYDRLTLAELGRDRRVIATGNGPAIAVSLDGDGPPWVLGGGDAIDAAAVDLDGDGVSEVVILGSEPGVWRHSAPAPQAPSR